MMAKNQKSPSTPTTQNTIQITFRVPEEWIERADKIAKKLSHEGITLTRTDGYRAAMATGFIQLEKPGS
jgi:hypothetical protein